MNKYYNSIVFLLITMCVHLTSSLKNKDRPCLNTDNRPCACIFYDGSGLDISNLSNYSFGWTKLNATTDILFRPCNDTSVGTNKSDDCFDGTSMCMRINNTSNVTEYLNFGKWKDGAFLSSNPREPISLQFKKNNRISIVEFACVEDKSVQPHLNATEFSGGKYVLTLSSHESCVTRLQSDVDKSSVSTGWLLIMIFIIITMIYFGIGILTLKFLRGAEGKEMIPNYEFWADLPYLVRDGILFTLNGFQPSPSYDRI